MASRNYAKVVVSGQGPSFDAIRQALAAQAHPGVDVGLVQVGAHEAVIRPHLLLHLSARNGWQPVDQILLDAGATRVEMITEEDAEALYRNRAIEDLQPRGPQAAPVDWHLDAVNVRAAWEALGGAGSIDWRGITVGQIDTGYTLHQAFGHDGDSWLDAERSRTFMEPDVPPEYGLPPVLGTQPGVDPMLFGALFKGHGTRIGATISGFMGTGPNHYRGIAPQVPHVMVRITDSVAIHTRQDEFVQALDYLVRDAKVDVVNVSLGIYPPVASEAIRKAMQRARDKGVIVVCAAGNHVNRVVVPARLDTAIAVGGTTVRNEPWFDSSYGPEVAFCAPARDIHRPTAQKSGVGTAFAGGGDGTSYAAAITSGAACLWLARWAPGIAAMYGRSAMRVKAFQRAAIATAHVPADWGGEPFGAGILDIGRLCTDMQRALPAIEGSFPMPAVPAAATGQPA